MAVPRNIAAQSYPNEHTQYVYCSTHKTSSNLPATMCYGSTICLCHHSGFYLDPNISSHPKHRARTYIQNTDLHFFLKRFLPWRFACEPTTWNVLVFSQPPGVKGQPLLKVSRVGCTSLAYAISPHDHGLGKEAVPPAPYVDTYPLRVPVG